DLEINYNPNLEDQNFSRSNSDSSNYFTCNSDQYSLSLESSNHLNLEDLTSFNQRNPILEDLTSFEHYIPSNLEDLTTQEIIEISDTESNKSYTYQDKEKWRQESQEPYTYQEKWQQESQKINRDDN
ncbi:17582_t:CDS:2, partial [Cetraspora pellucida]